jgi:CheY-like chemotaxis protein
MDNKKYILAVDDESINQMILKDMLEDEFEVVCADDGETCLKLVAERLPDLILLDVNMPGLDGLEVCKKIRDNPESINIPVMFISALARPEERMQGYKAGGDEYLTKPFVAEEILQKIKLLLVHKESIDTLKQTSDETMDAFMTSLNSSGEQGVVIYFMQQSFICQTIEELTQLAFDSLKEFGLVGSILTLAFDEPAYYFSDNKDRPLERDVLLFLSDKDKVISFADRAIFNSKNLTVLIRNMPDDDAKTGRYRDHLSMLADALAARITGIKNEQEVIKRKQILDDIMQASRAGLELIGKQHQSQRVKHTQILSKLVADIEKSFVNLGLNDEQEQKLIDLVLSTENETDKIYEESLQTDIEFNQIMKKFDSTLS